MKLLIKNLGNALVLILLLGAHLSYAFNKKKCGPDLIPVASDGLGGLITITADTTTSSVQFTSSWGGCSALGMHEQREIFYAQNADKIVQESARGSGEYLKTVALLSGCQTPVAQAKFCKAVRSNFESIYFSGSQAASNEQAQKRIDELIISNPELRKQCTTSG